MLIRRYGFLQIVSTSVTRAAKIYLQSGVQDQRDYLQTVNMTPRIEQYQNLNIFMMQ